MTLPSIEEIRKLVLSPPMSVDAASLIDLWRVEVVRFVSPRPPLLEDHPELSVRVRGAFGRRLAEIAPRIDRRGRIGPSAWDILFAPLAHRTAGTELPKPCVIRAWAQGDTMFTEVHLFGFAAICLDDAVEAMIAALAGGIALRAEQSQRVGIPVTDILVRTIVPVSPPDVVGSAVLSFRSPVIVRQKQGTKASDVRAILRSLPRRIASMARFQYCELVDDWHSLAAEINAAEVDDRALHDYRWVRHSVRQGNTGIPMQGYMGSIEIRSPSRRLAPYLCLAETCNTGSHASLGTGWFEAALY